jgi:hypothetical protein
MFAKKVTFFRNFVKTICFYQIYGPGMLKKAVQNYQTDLLSYAKTILLRNIIRWFLA